MNFYLKSTICAATGFGLMALVTSSANAAPASILAPSVGTATLTEVVTIQYRRHGGGGRYRSYGGRNIGLGIGAAIIGGIIMSEAARSEHRQSHGGAWQRCADTYRSFESDTGMYTGYDGIRRTCPYLN